MFGKNKWNKKSFVLKMVRENGLNLQYASDQLKNDKTVVLAAIQNNGEAIQHASPQFKNDMIIAKMAIVNSDGRAADYIDPQLQKNCNFMIETAKLISEQVSIPSSIYLTNKTIQSIKANNLNPTASQAKDLLAIAKAYRSIVEQHDAKTHKASEDLQAIYSSMGFCIPQSQVIQRAQLAEKQMEVLSSLGTESAIMHQNLETLSQADEIYKKALDQENQAS